MKRQGLTITLNELHNLIDELSKEFDDGSPFYATDDNRKFQINIINKTPECSDTWKLESNSQESLNVEKLDEMPDYETTDRVVAKDTRIPSNDNDKVIHPDSLLKKRTHRKCDDKYFDELPVTHCPLKTKQDEKDSK